VPLQKTFREAFLVVGEPDAWLQRCEHALVSQGFTSVRVDPALGQVRGDYKHTLGPSGGLVVTVTAEGPNTRLFVRVNASVNGVRSRSRRPTTRLIERFREGLTDEE